MAGERQAMRPHFASFVAGSAIATVVSISLAAQTPAPTPKTGASRAVPRTPDGHPDLQGTYDLATLTPVERRQGSPLVLTDEEAKKLEDQVANRYASLDAPIDGNRVAPPKGGDGSPGPYGNVGG